MMTTRSIGHLAKSTGSFFYFCGVFGLSLKNESSGDSWLICIKGGTVNGIIRFLFVANEFEKRNQFEILGARRLMTETAMLL